MSNDSTPSAATKLTTADLMTMPDEKNYELVDGQLKAKDSDFLSSVTAARLGMFLGSHAANQKLGCVLGANAGYQCFAPDLERVRRPDLSFIALERIPPNHSDLIFIPMPPDLAVEVISRHDLALEIDERVREYLAADVRLVWVIYPKTGQVLVYNSTGGKILSSADELSGEDVIPEFRLKISELLRKPGE